MNIVRDTFSIFICWLDLKISIYSRGRVLYFVISTTVKECLLNPEIYRCNKCQITWKEILLLLSYLLYLYYFLCCNTKWNRNGKILNNKNFIPPQLRKQNKADCSKEMKNIDAFSGKKEKVPVDINIPIMWATSCSCCNIIARPFTPVPWVKHYTESLTLRHI